MNDRRIRKVVIVGGGTAGWMTAAALARFLEHQPAAIELVESEAIGTVGVGEATIPPIRNFNAVLGIDEIDFIKATQATFKLGIAFEDWRVPGSRWFHGFGDYGPNIDGVSPHHHWRRLRAAGDPTSHEAYSLTTQMAALNRFRPPVPDPRSVYSNYAYAFQFDAGLYARYLRGYAEARGVTRTEGKIAKVDLRGADGFVEAVVLEDGRRIEGDLFIDCSGFRGLLIEEALGTGYEDWSHWLPVNRALAVPCARVGELTPYTTASADAAGWRWRIPLQHRTGNGYVFCDAFISEDEAAATLVSKLDGEALDTPRPLRFVTGRRRKIWNRNVVAVGLSSGFIEPLESTSIHLIQNAIGRLIEYFPDRDFDPKRSERFNTLSAAEIEHIRDFIVLHYVTAQRDDTPFWRHVRSIDPPDALKEQLQRFRRTGEALLKTEDSFLEPSWLAIYLGQDIVPEAHDPRADQIPLAELSDGMRRRREAVRQAAEALPPHAAFIDRFCKATPL